MTDAPAVLDEPVRVLLVDDDERLRQMIGDFLRAHTYEVFEAAGGAAMRATLARQPVDVIILDVMMPGEDGLSLARELSSQPSAAVIMVSSLGTENDRIVGLEVGADDYLPKPVSPRELLARIRAVLRRRNRGESEVETGQYLFAGWSWDGNRRVLKDPHGIVVSLSQGEFALLQAFLRRPHRVLTRDQLLEDTRSEPSDAFDRAIDSQVSRLRRKLAGRSDQELIRTIRNEGYMFVAKVDRR